jgi:hypothetical protein
MAKVARWVLGVKVVVIGSLGTKAWEGCSVVSQFEIWLTSEGYLGIDFVQFQ